MLQDISHAVLDVVHRSIAAFSAALNNGALILRKLPVELLCGVFELLPMSDCISASHVCHVWRDAILSGGPAIWSCVRYKSSPILGLSALLSRSVAADLELYVSATQRNWPEVAQGVTEHLHRCTVLKIDLYEPLPEEGQLAITRSLCLPAPRLRRLRLLDHLQQFNGTFDQTLYLFGGHAPRLDLVKVQTNVRALAPCEALGNVKRLLFCPSNQGALFDDITKLLERFPNLTGLAIELDWWQDDAPSASTSTEAEKPHSLPANLENLAVIANQSEIDPSGLMRRLRHHDVPQVSVTYNKPGIPADSASAMLSAICPPGHAPIVMRMEVLLSPDERIRVDMWFDGALSGEHTVRNIPLSARPGVDLFAGLVTLVIEDRLLCIGEPLPPAPALRTLSILLCSFYMTDDAQDSIFFLPRDVGTRIICPALLNVRFIGPPNMPPLHLDAGMICNVIERHVQYDASPLYAVCLKRTRLLENDPAAVARLLRLVQHIQIDDPEPAPVVITDAPFFTTGPYTTLLDWN
ncbi:hypothetical protein AURDEDRAFT_120815 [Auricularia subglabra TFB-10046 SS5]|nr:hypothetical protein AURDEDRAFT_120815 [Auricularia subglabra TFB-10046 SS5]